MNQYVMKPMKQLGLFEGGIEMKKRPAKRVNVVSLKLVRERKHGDGSLVSLHSNNAALSGTIHVSIKGGALIFYSSGLRYFAHPLFQLWSFLTMDLLGKILK